MAARFHQRMGGGRLFEREGLVDHRFDLALGDHRQRVVLYCARERSLIGDRARSRGQRAADDRQGQGQTGDLQDLPAQRGGRRPCADGNEQPYRQDRANPLKARSISCPPGAEPLLLAGAPAAPGPRNRRNVEAKTGRVNLFADFHRRRGRISRMIGIAAAGGSRLISLRCALVTVLALAASLWAAPAARAVEAVNVRLDAAAIDLTAATELQKTESDRTQVSTAPGPDGIVRRIEVRAREASTNWAVFALTNNSDEQIDRLIVVPHYRMVGSGLFWPDLGFSRIVSITPSSGDRPVRQENTTADIFRVTLDPGTVITFVAELRTDKMPQIYLWEPDFYKDKVNSFTLYYGIVIGIAGLLALFLTILFVVKGSVCLLYTSPSPRDGLL